MTLLDILHYKIIDNIKVVVQGHIQLNVFAEIFMLAQHVSPFCIFLFFFLFAQKLSLKNASYKRGYGNVIAYKLDFLLSPMVEYNFFVFFFYAYFIAPNC